MKLNFKTNKCLECHDKPFFKKEEAPKIGDSHYGGGVAPLGDPIDIKIKGCHLSLRKAEAATIGVERL